MFKYLLTFTLLSQSISSSAIAGDSMCGSLFESQSERERFAAALKDSEAYVENLAVSANSLRLKGYLGAGTTATVLLVQSGRKTYVLKLTRTPEESIPYSYKTIIMNKILGDMGLAPKVIGILNTSETKRWVQSNRSALKEILPEPKEGFETEPYLRATTGLILEVVKSALPRYDSKDAEIGLKEYALRGEPLVVEKEFHDSLVNQARAIDRVLSELGISPNDGDAIVTKSGKLMLMDTGMYYANPTGREFSSHEIEKFINKATTPKK